MCVYMCVCVCVYTGLLKFTRHTTFASGFYFAASKFHSQPDTLASHYSTANVRRGRGLLLALADVFVCIP